MTKKYCLIKRNYNMFFSRTVDSNSEKNQMSAFMDQFSISTLNICSFFRYSRKGDV